MRRINSMQKEMNSTQLCRLCLESSADVVNTFETFQDSTIASVLAEHFHFQINENDGMSEWVCKTCWSQTKNFHNFYKKLELLHQNYLNSIVLVKVDEIKRERSVSPTKETTEADIFADKYERETDIPIKADDTPTLSKDNSCDGDNNDKICDQSESEHRTDDDHDSDLDNPTSAQHSRSEREEKDEEIRRIFKMECEICNDNVEFQTLMSMRKHWREVHDTKGYLTCCGNKYATRWSMLDHVQYHVNPDAHRCDQCGKRFGDRKILGKHIKCHERAHKCSLCPSSFLSSVKLKYHVRRKHSKDVSVKSVKLHFEEENDDKSCDQSEAEQNTDDEDQLSPVEAKSADPSKSETAKEDADIRTFFRMKCEICNDDVEFETLKKVRKHFRQVHKRKGYLTCCGNKYDSRWSMLDHVQYHVNPDAHRCDQCGKTFRGRQFLRQHMQCHVRAHKCRLCSKTFSSARVLEDHVQVKHNTDTSAKFPCDQCGKTCKTKILLRFHIRNVHGPSVDHICEECGRTFKQKFNLKLHKISEHATTPPPNVQCDICGNRFKHKYSLSRHFKWHKEMQDIQECNAVSVNCPICKKKVQNKRLLDNHFRYTHGPRNHKCTFCDKAFRTSKALKEHTAFHTGQDLYSCPYCDRTSKSNANMYSHMKKAHLAEWTSNREKRMDAIKN